MTNYNNLTQEQKESITKELRDLFEEIKEFFEMWGGINEDSEKYYYPLKNKIKGFQEGLKTSIKIIDDEIEFLHNLMCRKTLTQGTLDLLYNRIEELEIKIGELKK